MNRMNVLLKVFFCYFLCLSCDLTFAQEFVQISTTPTDVGALYHTRQAEKEIDGSPLLLDDWESGTITVASNQEIAIENIQYDIFHRKILFKDYDKVYAVNEGLKPEGFKIGDRSFVKLFLNQDRVYDYLELKFDGVNSSLFKRYKCNILYGKASTGIIPATNDQFVIHSSYYIVNNDTDIFSFQLKKRDVLVMFGEHAEKVKKYAKSLDLSYKKEEHLIQIMSYYDELIPVSQ